VDWLFDSKPRDGMSSNTHHVASAADSAFGARCLQARHFICPGTQTT
jgi:hypothetical protein